MEVQTNGTIDPQKAVEDAARILAAYFTQLYAPVVYEEAEGLVLTGLDQSIDDLELPTRLINALKKGGFKRLSDFAKATRDDLLKVKNLGEKSIDEIISILNKKGVKIS
ncbi:MAG: hypothetical protein ACD_27C00048G0001 [uncultured bacterium]|nr:MAG: hypothetical protein ACD_27C00048G0001 [uncultured bacterium]